MIIAEILFRKTKCFIIQIQINDIKSAKSVVSVGNEFVIFELLYL